MNQPSSDCPGPEPSNPSRDGLPAALGHPGHSNEYSRERVREDATPTAGLLPYAQRVKLIRLLASAAIELRVANPIAEQSLDSQLREHTLTAYRGAVQALGRLLLDEARTLSKEDRAMLDPTIIRAMADL